jgi:hypothetical protein
VKCSSISNNTIAGGYTPLTPVVLCNLLSLLRLEQISFRAARTFLACIAVKAIRDAAFSSQRKDKIPRERIPQYDLTELHHRIGGVGGEYLREDLRLLEKRALLTFSATEIVVTTTPLPEAEELLSKVAELRHQQRTIPVPRRLLEFLCQVTKPSLFKVMLAYLLRGLSLKRGGTINAKGSAKSSWMAEIAGVSLRAVKAVRQCLISIGWLGEDNTTSQRKLNKTGAYFTINLEWAPPKEPPPVIPVSPSPNQTTADFAPQSEVSTGDFAPPYRDIDLPTEEERDQNLAKPNPTGVCQELEKIPQPSIRNVIPLDLTSTLRALALFEDAVGKGMIADTEANRLNWLAAAVRARMAKAGDPIRIFMGIVRRKLWHHITHAEEDRARKALRRFQAKERENPRNMPNVKHLEASHIISAGEILRSFNFFSIPNGNSSPYGSGS